MNLEVCLEVKKQLLEAAGVPDYMPSEDVFVHLVYCPKCEIFSQHLIASTECFNDFVDDWDEDSKRKLFRATFDSKHYSPSMPYSLEENTLVKLTNDIESLSNLFRKIGRSYVYMDADKHLSFVNSMDPFAFYTNIGSIAIPRKKINKPGKLKFRAIKLVKSAFDSILLLEKCEDYARIIDKSEANLKETTELLSLPCDKTLNSGMNYLNASIKLCSGRIDSMADFALAKFFSGEFEEATNILDSISDRIENNGYIDSLDSNLSSIKARILNHKGVIYHHLKDHELGLDYVNKSLDIEEDDSARYNQVLMECYCNRYDRAESILSNLSDSKRTMIFELAEKDSDAKSHLDFFKSFLRAV